MRGGGGGGGSVRDADLLGSDLIGTYTVDLAFVWNQPYHEIYQVLL